MGKRRTEARRPHRQQRISVNIHYATPDIAIKNSSNLVWYDAIWEDPPDADYQASL